MKLSPKQHQEDVKSYLRSGGGLTRHREPSVDHKNVFEMFTTFILDTSTFNDVVVGLG